MTKIAVTKCSDYLQPNVDQAVHAALELIGGISTFVTPNQKVLIKPNVLINYSPDKAATTHPTVVAAVVKEVLKAGGIPLVGDSPGNAFGNVEQFMVITGIK